MISRHSAISRLAGCALFLVVASATIHEHAAAQEPDPKLQKVIADWKKRRDSIQAIDYQVTGEHIYIKGTMMDSSGEPRPDWPPRDTPCQVRRRLLLDFVKMRHRLEIDEDQYRPKTASIKKDRRTMAFDGRELRGIDYEAPAGRNNGGISTGDMFNAAFDPMHWPMFIGVSAVVIDPRKDRYLPGKFIFEPDFGRVYFFGEGIHERRTCWIFRTHARKGAFVTYTEYWVDPARESAILRYLLMENGVPSHEFTIQYESKTGILLPQQWTYLLRDYADGKGKLLLEERMRMQDIKVNLPVTAADFSLDFPSGSLIHKAEYSRESDTVFPTAKNETLFRVGTDGSWTEVIIKDGTETPRRRFSFWWLLCGVPLVGAIGWFGWRRLNTRRNGRTV